jgi:hypothetical protein
VAEFSGPISANVITSAEERALTVEVAKYENKKGNLKSILRLYL